MLTFFLAKLGLIHFNSSQAVEITVFGIITDITTICSLLTEAQVMILVGLVVCFEKKGFITSVILSVMTLITHLFPLLLGEKIISVIGMIMIVGAALICMIIY